jgi:protein-S-isoprenylcysteine O-methyltransferase Ste14
MASTVTTTTTSGSLVFERREAVHKYHWPALQLNIWMFVMLLASTLIIGVFATFVQIQQQLLLPIPWYFPYFITVASIAVLYVGLIVWLISQRRLLPSIVMIGAFMVFVLWFVGLIVISINLWGPTGSVIGDCNLYVFGQNPQGQFQSTLAWLEQKNICKCPSWVSAICTSLTAL